MELIARSKGRLIVTGMGKSGHVGRKIAATFASTGTPAYFVHPGEASHGDLGMITPDDVIMALSWSGETVELKDLIDYSRRFGTGLIAVTAEATSTLAKSADVVLLLPQAREACPHNLAPTTSSLMQLALGDALAVALLGKPRLHGARLPRPASGRTARREAEIHPRRDAYRRKRAADRARHRDVGRDRRDDRERLRLRRHHGCRTAGSPASSPTAICAVTWAPDLLAAKVDDVMTQAAEDRERRSARQRGAGAAQLIQDHRRVRGRYRHAGRHRASARSAARGRGLKRDALVISRQVIREARSIPKTGIRFADRCLDRFHQQS